MGRGGKVSAGKLLKSIFLDLLFPEYCVACGSFLFLDHHYIACNECWESYFREFKGKKCLNCGYPFRLKPGIEAVCRECLESGRTFYFDGVNYFGVYSELIDLSIKALKFEKKLPVSWEIGKTIENHLRSYIGEIDAEIVVPVPLHPEELKERGFNQCEEILKGAGISFFSLVEKVYNTEKQASLPANRRRENIKGIFRVTGNVKSKRVLIFDDVFTTGSTVNEIAKELKEKGASKVFVYTVARSI